MIADILVIGSGISGLTFAIKVAEKNSNVQVVSICKNSPMESNTRYAQGGIAVVSNFQKDSHEKHIQDTLLAGARMGDPEVVDFVVKEGNERLAELMAWGAHFDTETNAELHLVKEGGHSEKRIVHYKDKTGQQIQEKLVDKIKSLPNVILLEGHTLVDLITDHHTKTNYERCYGAYVISKEKQEIIKIASKLTVLSTGGIGSLYAHTTNPPNATGDGLGAAYRAKVYMEDLPYVQFHPTALLPKVNGHTFLISEAVRGAGALLKNAKGDYFMSRYDKRGELAPRDIVSRAIQIEIQKSGTDSVFLDCTAIKQEKFVKAFPQIFETCQELGIDPSKDAIPVIPAAHYICGGIKVDAHAESELKGLYAIGECSCTGLHGANRLASNSLLESLVFSHRAAVHAIDALHDEFPDRAFYDAIPEWQGEPYISYEKDSTIESLRVELQEIMTVHVGIFKTNKSLKKAENELENIYEKVMTMYRGNKLTPELCELRNMVSIAHLLTQQALDIKINKGVFYNEDNEY